MGFKGGVIRSRSRGSGAPFKGPPLKDPPLKAPVAPLAIYKEVPPPSDYPKSSWEVFWLVLARMESYRDAVLHNV